MIRARLSDARFFYQTDLKTKLEDRLPKFEQIVFHEKLGTQAERIARIERLAAEIAKLLWVQRQKFFEGKFLDAEHFQTEQQYVGLVDRAAKLCKADLLTEVVGEFPETQGLMGRYYALAQGEHASVAAASEEHYKPQGPNDRVPTDPVSVAVALADKIDTLVGFWAIDEKPTGSKDPYALRRAALGVIRIVVENNLRLGMYECSIFHSLFFAEKTLSTFEALVAKEAKALDFIAPGLMDALSRRAEQIARSDLALDTAAEHFHVIVSDLLSFFADRLKVQLRDQGARYDLVDAVFALQGQDDLLMIVRRVEALGKFLETEDGKNLLAGFKRAVNILRIEEKKDNKAYDGAVDAKLLTVPEEKTLAKAIADVTKDGQRRCGEGRLRRRDERDGKAAAGGGCVLRQGEGQRRRQGRARQPPDAAEPDPRRHPRGRRFFQDPGLSVTRGRAAVIPGRSRSASSPSLPLASAEARRAKAEASGGEGSGVGGRGACHRKNRPRRNSRVRSDGSIWSVYARCFSLSPSKRRPPPPTPPRHPASLRYARREGGERARRMALLDN